MLFPSSCNRLLQRMTALWLSQNYVSVFCLCPLMLSSFHCFHVVVIMSHLVVFMPSLCSLMRPHACPYAILMSSSYCPQVCLAIVRLCLSFCSSWISSDSSVAAASFSLTASVSIRIAPPCWTGGGTNSVSSADARNVRRVRSCQMPHPGSRRWGTRWAAAVWWWRSPWRRLEMNWVSTCPADGSAIGCWPADLCV